MWPPHSRRGRPVLDPGVKREPIRYLQLHTALHPLLECLKLPHSCLHHDGVIKILNAHLCLKNVSTGGIKWLQGRESWKIGFGCGLQGPNTGLVDYPMKENDDVAVDYAMPFNIVLGDEPGRR